eukprot:scaffold69635_cov58-Attheya_sp.AAC.5
MRRSGSSSSCLRSNLSLDELANQEAKHFCVMNTKELPHYSTERFYMLSELEVHAHSVQFVCDAPREKSSHVILYILWRPEEHPSTPSAFCNEILQPCILHFFDEDRLQQSVEESTASRKRAAHSIGLSLSHSSDHDGGLPSPFSHNNHHNTTSPAVSPTNETQAKANNFPSQPKIYLVVDRVVPMAASSSSCSEEEIRRNFEAEERLSRNLARYVAQTKPYRHLVDGICVGTANDVHAAPGLEACHEAVRYASAERRQFLRSQTYAAGWWWQWFWQQRSSSSEETHRRGVVDPIKSVVGFVCPHPDDLMGMDDAAAETDAVQGILQSRTVAEWKGKGDILSFALRAQRDWRQTHGMYSDDDENQEGPISTRRSRRRDKRSWFWKCLPWNSRSSSSHKVMNQKERQRLEHLERAEETAMIMIVAFVLVIASYLWKTHGNIVAELLSKLKK